MRAPGIVVAVALSTVAGCTGGSSNSSPRFECVRENDEYTCTGDTKRWPACPGSDIRRGACALDEPACMGCNPSVAGFACRCVFNPDAGEDAGVHLGVWTCIGTGAGCGPS